MARRSGPRARCCMIDSDVEKSGAKGPGAPPPGGPRLYLASLAILWERLWPALWPALALAGLFLVLALADLFRYLPGWLHVALLAAFAATFLFALFRAAWSLRPPGVAAARRRLERASGL